MLNDNAKENVKQNLEKNPNSKPFHGATRGARDSWGISEFKQECIQEMAANGCPFPNSRELRTGDTLNRYSRDGKHNEPDEWYVAHENLYTDSVTGNSQHHLIVNYGSWSDSSKYTYYSWKKDYCYSREYINQLNEARKEKQQEVDAKLQTERDQEAKKAAQVWEEAKKTKTDKSYTSYIEKKGVAPLGIRYGLNPSNHPSIIIPFKNTDGEIRAIEYVSLGADGKKYTRCFGSKKGCLHVVDDKEIKNGDSIIVAEGWATAVSIYMAVGGKVCAVGGSVNIDNAIGSLRKKYPDSQITIAADLEKGEAPALDAAKKYATKIVLPMFPKENSFDTEKNKPYTDFNDLHKVCGLDAVRLQLSKTIAVKSLAEEFKELADQRLKKDDPLASFQVNKLPKVLRDYISSQCKKSNIVHPLSVTTAAIVEVSAYLGTQAFTDFHGIKYPNLWMLTIAVSGTGKSTALKLGSENARANYVRVIKQLQQLNSEIAQSEGATKNELEAKHLSISIQNVILPEKSTGEALLDHLSKGHYGAIYCHEISSWLQNLNKSHNSDLKAMFTSLYDGNEIVENNTIGRGRTIIENAFISICGMSTIDWVKPIVNMSDIKSGFLPRFLMFVLPSASEDPGLWAEVSMLANTDEMNRYNQALEAIKTRANLEQIFLPLSAAARNALSNDTTKEGIYWDLLKIRDQYQDEMRRNVEIFINRWLANIVKIAIIIQLLIDHESTEISDQAIYISYSIVLAAAQSTILLLKEELGESKHEQECRQLENWILERASQGKAITRFDIQRCKVLKNPGDTPHYDRVIETLLVSNKVTIVTKPQKKDWEYHPVK